MTSIGPTGPAGPAGPTGPALQYFPLPNVFTLSANINYPGSGIPQRVHWNTLNGVLCAISGGKTLYIHHMNENSNLDYMPSADVTVDDNQTWFTVLRDGIYDINASIIFDQQNATAYYQLQLLIKRAGSTGSGTYHAQSGQAVILQSDVVTQSLRDTRRFNAGDQFSLYATFSQPLDLLATKPVYYGETKMEVARIL